MHSTKMLKLKILLLLSVTTLCSGVTGVFHVSVTKQACHASQHCHTLEEYAQNTELFENHTNITLIFHNGHSRHTLSQELSLLGVEELSMFAEGEKVCTEPGYQVTIHLQAKISLNVSSKIKVCGIVLTSDSSTDRGNQGVVETFGPTTNIILQLVTLTLASLSIQQAGYVRVCNCDIMSELQFTDTNSITIIGTNLTGHYSRHQSTGVYSSGVTITPPQMSTAAVYLEVQGSRISNNYYGVYLPSLLNGVHLNVTNSHFEGNRYALNINSSQVNTTVAHTNFTNNHYGIFINGFFTGSSNFQEEMTIITETRFERNIFGLTVKNLQADLKVFQAHFASNSHGISLGNVQGEVTFTNTEVLGSYFGMHLKWGTAHLSISNISVLNCQFGMLLVNISSCTITDDSTITNNEAGITATGSEVNIQDTFVSSNRFGVVVIPPDTPGISSNVTILSSNFSSNSVAGLALINSRDITIVQNSVFFKNTGTPIIAYRSTFELMGETVFRNNRADRGGGLALYNSTVTFSPASHTSFINNTALDYGGAIYTVSALPSILPDISIAFENIQDFEDIKAIKNNDLFGQDCFFVTGGNATIHFTGNNASLGGLDIYGPTLYREHCSPRRHFTFEDNSISQVASEPSRVCFCENDVPQCESTDIQLPVKRFPGEELTVSVALAGYNFGSVAGSVYTNVADQDYQEVIDLNQHVQTTNLTCSNLSYFLHSKHEQKERAVLVLTAQDHFKFKEADFETNFQDINCTVSERPCSAILTTPIFINVTLETCPLGFILNLTTGKCECDRIIQENITHDDGTGLTCKIRDRTGYINRRRTVWVGVDARLNNTDMYYWYTSCQRDYCKASEVQVDLRHPDVQCEPNRGGILCGGCRNGSSLMLGSNRCSDQCTDVTLTLITVFAILGILLVILISTLDLTVANGTINGLIYYANIVWINKTVLFSTIKEQKYIIPIAWLNLDFGIETCFSENLDQLTKTGLQFVFPVYLWCIAGLIIVICHYSTRATKLFRSNSVPVLATLFLLSYGKIFRNIMEILIYADLKNSGIDHSKRIVWAFDGNVNFDHPIYILLIIVALSFLFLFVLPFTLMVLLVPFLKVKSDHRLLCWINRLNPFFDTYYGPFNHKKRFHSWTGILLVARTVTLIACSSIPADDPFVNVLFLIITNTFLLVSAATLGRLYKNLYLSLMELSYFFNLNILGAAVLLYQSSPRVIESENNPNPVVIISVTIVLLQLVGILIFHTVSKISSLGEYLKCRQKKPKPVVEARNPTSQVIDANIVYDETRYRDSILA